MSEQLYEQTVPFLGQSLLVCKPMRMEDTATSALTQECLAHAFSPEHGSSSLPHPWEFSFTECAAEIPLTTCTKHQQASSLPKLPQKWEQNPSHTSDLQQISNYEWDLVLNKGCSSLVYSNHHKEVLLFKYQPSPLLSRQHFSPCLWGTWSKWAKQALVCPPAMCWQADSHLTRDNWSSVAAELFPPGRLELHLSLTLSKSWAQWQLLKVCQAEKQNLLGLLVSLSAMWFFIKGLFRLRKILEAKRLAEFEKIRVAHCLTLDK